jgi:hypothetical protein
VQIVITDVKGDTVRTMTTNARPAALRWITWDLRRSRAPLSPSQVQDSIRQAQRMAFLRDSIRTAMGPDTVAGRRRLAARDPQPGEPGVWQNPLLQQLGGGFGGGGGGGGGFGGGAPLVEPGTYLVTIRLNGREHKQTVRVERPTLPGALAGGWQ